MARPVVSSHCVRPRGVQQQDIAFSCIRAGAQVRNFAAPAKGKKSKAKKQVRLFPMLQAPLIYHDRDVYPKLRMFLQAKGAGGVDIPKEDLEWVLSFLEPEWAGQEVELEPEDAERLQQATKEYQAYVGRETRRMDGEIHRLIKLRAKALEALPEDLKALALREMRQDEPKVRTPTWTPPEKLYR